MELVKRNSKWKQGHFGRILSTMDQLSDKLFLFIRKFYFGFNDLHLITNLAESLSECRAEQTEKLPKIDNRFKHMVFKL